MEQSASPRKGNNNLLIILFVVYVALLAWIVLWKLEVPHIGGGALRQIKLIPFASSGGAGASAPLEVVANIVFFVPFGLYLRLLAPSLRWWKAAVIVAGVSLLLEVGQYVLALGSSDVTDLVSNIAGGLVGIGLLALARRRLQDRTTTIMTRVCLIATSLILLAVGIFVASPLRYAPPAEVAIGSTHSVRVQNVGQSA